MKVLVTGGNGLLGHNIIKQLLENNHTIHAIVRNYKNIIFQNPRLVIFEGNFLDYDQLKKAAEECDAIIHAASATDMSLPYSSFKNINVEGSKNILRVAETLHINNIVYISTINTIGYGTFNKWATESTLMEYPVSESSYAKTKKEAEQLFINAAKKYPNKHVIVINPSFMLGAYDTRPSSGQMILMAYRKPIMIVPKGGKSFVHVQDVARMAINALTKGTNGEKYIITSINMSIREFYKLQRELCHYHQWIINIPNRLLNMIGFVGDILQKVGFKTQICSMNTRQLCIREYYSNQKAIQDLDFEPTSIKTAISDSVAWFFPKKTQ